MLSGHLSAIIDQLLFASYSIFRYFFVSISLLAYRLAHEEREEIT
jgi:hypothetical protein